MKYPHSVKSFGAWICFAASLLFCPAVHAQKQEVFEQPGNYPIRLFVPDSVIKGSLHRVRPTAYCDGLTVKRPQQVVLVYTNGGISDKAQEACEQDKVDVSSHVSLE